MALWYDATDASTITTANFSGVSRVISFVSKGYSALTLSNDYLTSPLSAPRYIPSSTFVGKNTIRFSGETAIATDRQKLISNTGTTANISLPNGSTFILFQKHTFTSNYQSVVVDAKQQRNLTSGVINTFFNNTSGTILYGPGTNGTQTTLSTINSGGASNYAARQSISAYTNCSLQITKLDSPTTRLPYCWVNKTQLEKAGSAYGLLETSGSTINYIAMGGRISQFSATGYFSVADGVGSEFYEYLVYDKVLTDAELDDVYNYFNAKYAYNSLYDSANYNTYDVKVENFVPYGQTSGSTFNNFFSINGNPPGQMLDYNANQQSIQNPLYYVRSSNTFDGVNKAYINRNQPAGFTERNANGFFVSSQLASYGDPSVRVITYGNDGSGLQVASGCNWTNSSLLLAPNIDYQITGSTENVCGYTSATTWNTFIEYNSSATTTSFNIQNSYSGFNQTTTFAGTGVSGTTLIASGQPDNLATTINNSTIGNTGYTETFELWICDSVGNDIQLLSTNTGLQTASIFKSTSQGSPISVPNTSSQTYWYSQNHFKIKYTAL
jgi:hypothetical protein